jgi:hypothetical protein
MSPNGICPETFPTGVVVWFQNEKRSKTVGTHVVVVVEGVLAKYRLQR